MPKIKSRHLIELVRDDVDLPCGLCSESPCVTSLRIARRRPLLLCLDCSKQLRLTSHRAIQTRLRYGKGAPIKSVEEMVDILGNGVVRAVWNSATGSCVNNRRLMQLPLGFLRSGVKANIYHYRIPVLPPPLPSKKKVKP